MLSDFMDKDYEKTLRIASKKHDFTGIRVYDPIEKRLPNLGIIPIKDSETGIVKWVSTFPKKTGNCIQKNIGIKLKLLKKFLKKWGRANKL